MFKFRYLDGLRGWAALVVVVDHYFFAFAPSAIAGGVPTHHLLEKLIYSTPLYLFVDGDFSVAIFFVLSGIVLSAKFFRTGEEQSVIESGVKRYFRLAIPVIGSILIAFVLFKLGMFRNHDAAALSGSNWFSAFWQFQPRLLDALKEGLLNRFLYDVPSGLSYNAVLWTMQLEFLGSFLIFMTLLIFGKLRRRSLVYLFLIMGFWKTFYLAFILGIIICDYLNRPIGKEIQRIIARGYWIPILLIALFMGSYPLGDVDGTSFSRWAGTPLVQPWTRIVMHVLGAFGVIIAVMCAKPLQKLLTTRPSLFLGRISFSMYLIHFMILGSYASYLFIKLNESFGYRTSFILTFIPTLVIVITAAYLYAKYVDEKAISFSKTIYRKVFLPREESIESSGAIPSIPESAGVFIYGTDMR